MKKSIRCQSKEKNLFSALVKKRGFPPNIKDYSKPTASLL